MLQSMPAETLKALNEDGAAPPQTTHREWLDNHTRREAIRLKWAEFFENYDAIIMPISPVPPFPHNQEGNFGTRTLQGSDGQTRPYSDLIRWTILTGMAYLPATTPPIGRDSDGLPVSFQRRRCLCGPYGGATTRPYDLLNLLQSIIAAIADGQMAIANAMMIIMISQHRAFCYSDELVVNVKGFIIH